MSRGPMFFGFADLRVIAATEHIPQWRHPGLLGRGSVRGPHSSPLVYWAWAGELMVWSKTIGKAIAGGHG